MAFKVEQNVPLAKLTTIKLGGLAQYFSACASVAEIREALDFARRKDLPVYVLGGGSNTVFADAGFAGLVLRVALKGQHQAENGQGVLMTAGAGENWDDLVSKTVAQGLAGLECLSGIPGLVGATPMQNVGAYGREVSELVTRVEAINRESGEIVNFTNQECEFDYRTSRFKGREQGKYIITEVVFRLAKDGIATLNYPPLAEALGGALESLPAGVEQLTKVREVVLSLRQAKAMVIDETDFNTRSCGSFFLNVLLSTRQLEELKARAKNLGVAEPPSFPAGDKFKVPAAWLVEQAGFSKGYRRGGVGISTKHALALININGSTEELLTLKDEIQTKVKEYFGLEIVPEPVIV